jgi:hypothetical protein
LNIGGWHATLFGPEALPTLVQPSHLPGAQGARTVGILLGPPEMLWKYCQMRNQVTLREVGELRLYLMLVVPDELTLKILGPKQ